MQINYDNLNRKGRRAYAARALSKRPEPKYLTAAWQALKWAIEERVERKIAATKARKIERLAKLEISSTPEKASKINKMSAAEQKQLRRKVKAIKFANKLRALV